MGGAEERTCYGRSIEGVDVADPSGSAASGVLGKSRMEAFSDGVLAIAITLLVLDLSVHPPGSPLHEFLAAWPR